MISKTAIPGREKNYVSTNEIEREISKLCQPLSHNCLLDRIIPFEFVSLGPLLDDPYWFVSEKKLSPVCDNQVGLICRMNCKC